MPTVSKQSAPSNHRQSTPKPSVSTSSSAWDLIDSLRVLVYGESGTGKTTFWATFPGPILALICSGGNKPGELRSIDTPEYRKKITAKVIRSTDDFKHEVAQAGEYATVVLDHISGLQDLDLKEVLGIDEIPLTKNWGMAAQDQYGQASRHTIEYCQALLNLPGNVIIIGQEKIFKPRNETGSDIVKPVVGASVMPSVHSWLAPSCDYVFQTFKRQKVKKENQNGVMIEVPQRGVDYCLRTEEHEIYLTKFRIPKSQKSKRPLPDVIVDPSYEKLMKVIKG